MAIGKFLPAQVLPLWYRALGCEIGIAVATTDRRHLMNVLYEARSEEENEELQKLIIFSPREPANELWICKKTVELD